MKELTAPEIDKIIGFFGDKLYNPERYDIKVKNKINKLYELLDKIKPLKDDDFKIIYFSASRGTIENYGDYEELKLEEDVSNYEQFLTFYNEDYPEEVCWYRLATSKYENYRTISLNYKTIIYADMNEENDYFNNIRLQELLDFLIYKISESIKMLENNTYNTFISDNLSFKNRFGVIKRSDYWNLFPESKKEILEYLTLEEINDFITNASENVSTRIKKMTSGKYFEAVRLAYQNNNYEINNLNDKELYLKYADGRDEGLTEINLNSSKEFDDWYNDKNRQGGHPYEIMRGHSFYRVNLHISHDENGYYLSLDGNIILRKVEIVKIFLALKNNNIPIKIYNVDVIKKALLGNDYIGIVPRGIIPIRCESYFEKYKPLEFIHLDDKKILDYIIWEDIEEIYLK